MGISARAAAQSALRGGLLPTAIDAFGDADLRACGPVSVATPFPAGVADAAQSLSAEHWIYTGSLENHLDLVASLSHGRRLLGCNADSLQCVRNPVHLAVLLRAIHEIGPRVLEQMPERLGRDRWLFKPLASGGGRDIHPWPSDEAWAALDCGQRGYWQTLVEGRPCSAAFLADGVRCRLLGVTRQLVGRAWGAAGRFEYCGSIGPLTISPRSRQTLRRIGQAFTEVFGLCGLFGVDLVRDFRGFWPIEVNPRYTASMELFDWAWGESLVGWHVSACLGEWPTVRPTPATGYFGKLYVFAPRALTAPAGLSRDLRERQAAFGWPAFGDVPVDGAAIPAGGPIATVFAHAATLKEVKQALRRQTHGLRRRLGLG
ncbi:MAG: ATP-grasp domain-containing protein [Pirellulales bacterium]